MSGEKLVLSDLTMDFDHFTSQFEAFLATTNTWKGNLTTQTSQTLIELVAATGTFMQGRLVRAREDSFAETSQSDDAIRYITQMQGLRMSRKLPSTISVDLISTVNITISPLTQFTAGGISYFNREQVTLHTGTPFQATLYQGEVRSFVMNGLGTVQQTFLSEEDAFQISDQDVLVLINNVAIPKAFGGLWNYRSQPAYADLTAADGRLLVVFGDDLFGSKPKTNDIVLIRYPVTAGNAGNNQKLVGKTVTVAGLSTVTGTITSNPSGGSDEKPINAYKNLASGSFGTYSSAVTKSQYEAAVGVYPGIVDAFTQAQRDINPGAVEWMNVIRVSGLTNSPWSQQQKQDFLNYMQTVSMYAPRFVWQDPIPVARVIDLTVFCFNSAVLSVVKQQCEDAINALFNPRPGLLMTNFYASDLTKACIDASQGAVSYVIINEPLGPMIVTTPPSPVLKYEVVDGGGVLSTYSYSYGIASVTPSGEEGPPSSWVFAQVISDPPTAGVFLKWNEISGIDKYKIYGRKAGQIGLLATVNAGDPLEYNDTGADVPGDAPPNSLSQVPVRYNMLAQLTVNAQYAERQQRLENVPYRGI